MSSSTDGGLTPRRRKATPRRTFMPRRGFIRLGGPEIFSCRFSHLALVLPSFQSTFLLLNFPSYSAKHYRMGD